MRRFRSGSGALIWMYEHVDRDWFYALYPPQSVTPNQVKANCPVRAWDYPEDWYTFLELIYSYLELPPWRKQIVESYFRNVYPEKDEAYQGAFDQWMFRDKWAGTCRMYWRIIPPELKRRRL